MDPILNQSHFIGRIHDTHKQPYPTKPERRKNMNDKQIEEELQEIQEEKMSNQEAFGFNGNIDEE